MDRRNGAELNAVLEVDIRLRVTLDPTWTALDLLRRIPNQLNASRPFESLGFREIV